MNAHSILKRILVIILFTTGFAGSSTIKGKITDIRSGEPLIGANIMLSGTMLGSATNENGDYLISDVPIGSFTIMAMFIGYETIEKEIQVAADQEYTVNLTLKASAIELQETKVTAEKRKEKITTAPASMEIITSRDIKGKNTTNMGAYLKGLKGIDFTSSGINNYSISVRGFNSSFNTRLLTLSDGRVANIPALRVINYSTIPQSMDDVDKIEVVLGPATALYGANAHSGVVNIISKPPSRSEGFTMSLSGSNDERQFRKINGRFAKKLSNAFSIKMSGLYLHAYDWPFISEEEYKSHRYPWTLTPGRTADGKDNNPWNTNGTESQLIFDWAIRDNDGDGIYSDSVYVRIGNGEANHGDLDGDGVQEIAVASKNDAGDSGEIHIHYMNTDGSIKSTVELNDNHISQLATTVAVALEGLGDIDGDGVGDMAVGLKNSDVTGTDRGGVLLVYLNSNGSAKSIVEFNDSSSNGPTLADGDLFGSSIANMGDLDGYAKFMIVGTSFKGDLDGNNVIELAVGAKGDDMDSAGDPAGATNRGATHILFLK